jgi:hypothetical protein
VRSQHGMMLVMLVCLIGLAATVLLLGALNSNRAKIERDRKTVSALAEAKMALIGRAAADGNHPGSLPCPDGNNDGSADLFAGTDCPAYIGRFPWKTLGTGTLVDGDGEALWYALSSNYRDHVLAEPINGTAPGSVRVDDAGDQIAIVLSPGNPLSTQTHRPSNRISDYLEGENADGDADFSRQPAPIQNDRLIAIGRIELFATVSQRVLREIQGNAMQGMRKYYAGVLAFPYADVDGDGNADVGKLAGMPSHRAGPGSLFFDAATSSMLLDNDWLSQVHYAVSGDLKSATLQLNGKVLTMLP